MVVTAARAAEPKRHIWLKAVAPLPDDLHLHRNLLAYVSDYQLVGTATLPHEVSFVAGNLQMASLDHAMWFHQAFRIDEWLLYVMESPSASGAAGRLASTFTVASVVRNTHWAIWTTLRSIGAISSAS